MSLSLVVATFLCLISPSFGQKEPTPESNVLLDKIKRIEIPGVNFHETPLDEVLNTLQAYSRANDPTEANRASTGVLIIPMLKGEPVPKITITLSKMSLERMLDFITEMIGWSYELRDVAIVVSKRPFTKATSQGLKIEFFEVSLGTIIRMTGAVPLANASGPPDPFGSGAAAGPNDQAGKIKQYLVNAGIRFDETKGHKFVFDGFQIMATHDQESIDRIRAILLELDPNVSRQITVEFKILEAPLGALDKAIDKAVGENQANAFQAMQIESRLAEKAFLELGKSEYVELKSLPRFVVMDGQPASLRIGEEMIYPTDFMLPNPATDPTIGKNTAATSPLPRFDTVAPDDEQPGFRQVGIRIAVTPRYEPQFDRIKLEMAPQITEFKGYEEFGAGIKVPKFWSWSLNTSVNLRRNHSMIFRGPASDGKREIIIFLQANAFR